MWYFVMDGEEERLNKDIVAQVSKAKGIGIGAMSDKAQELCQLLLYSKQLMFNPGELQASGVVVHRHVQRAGEVVVGKGTCAHWGTVSGDLCVQQAVNLCGPEWLDDGLVRLIDFIKLAREYFDRESEIARESTALHALLYHSQVQFKLRHHVADRILVPLLTAVLQDLGKEASGRRYAGQLADVALAKQRITDTLELLQDKRLQQTD